MSTFNNAMLHAEDGQQITLKPADVTNVRVTTFTFQDVSDGNPQVAFDGVTKVLNFVDDAKIVLGTGNDWKIFTDSAHTFAIQDGNNSRDFLNLKTSGITFGNVTDALAITVYGASTFENDVTIDADLKLEDSASDYVGFSAPATVGTSYTLTFPADVGSAGQVLAATDGAGTLAWASQTNTQNTLDQAYDEGGSGSGRIITADSGAVKIVTSANDAFDIIQSGAHNAVQIAVDTHTTRTAYAVQMSWGEVAYTGKPHGISMSWADVISITNAGEYFGVYLEGITNSGSGDSIGIAVYGFDTAIRIADNSPVTFGNQDDASIQFNTTGDDALEIKTSSSQDIKLDPDGVVVSTKPIQLPSYTVAGPPPTTHSAGEVIYVADGAAGSPVLAFSDGTNWKRCDTLATISK